MQSVDTSSLTQLQFFAAFSLLPNPYFIVTAKMVPNKAIITINIAMLPTGNVEETLVSR